MSSHPTTLKLVSTGEAVDAELHDSLSLDDLLAAEEVWAPERVRVIRACLKNGIKPEDVPQSVGWNWSTKALSLQRYAPGPFSSHRLFGLKCQESWQGLLLACCVGHYSKLEEEQKEVVYVDFVETAPWNWELSAAGRTADYKGVGRQLFELAVRWSDDLGFRGRVGLHSLPQADSFYRSGCGMTELAPDPKQLRYFELSESQARAFLEEDSS